MREDVKNLWVKALRSGNYKQGLGRLHRQGAEGDVYCCLGVLCELAIKMGVDVSTDSRYGSREYDGELCVLPASVREWAEMYSSDGTLDDAVEVELGEDDEMFSALDAYNDDAGATFDQIADVIEKQWESI